MLITFYCTHCNAKLRINANAMGRSLQCPECQGEFEVPHLEFGPGFVVGGFLIKHRIGQGGMGEVYLAKQLSLERDVALKILPAQFTQQSSFVVRFLKEVHYQAKMDHPNIVTAYDAGEDSGVYFMAMAHVAGETMEAMLDREGCLPEAEALKIVRQVALALQYAYEQKNILHRDIKPGNIMITPTLHAKVLDMGLSKNLLDRNSTTHANTLMGTPNYMSPEQIDHPQEIDTRSDMFSLGMTLYHALTGKVPFEDTSYLKTLKRHAAEKLEDPRSLIPGIHRHTVHLLARLLARDANDRFATWEGVLAALDRALTHTGPPVSLPAGESTLALDAEHEPVPEKPQKERPPEPEPEPAPRLKARVEAVPRPVGILVSVGLGLLLGLGGIQVLVRFLPAPVVPPPDAEPTVIPDPEPGGAVEVPDPVLPGLRDRFGGYILEFEKNPEAVDAVLAGLVELARESQGTPLAQEVAQQIVRIRRSREEAVEAYRLRLEANTRRILVEQGPQAARQYLRETRGAFQTETEGLRGRLVQQIRERERMEREQRAEDLQRAKERYQTLLADMVAPVLGRDWTEALRRVGEAVDQPVLFPLAEEVGALRGELLRLQSVQLEIIEMYRAQRNQPVRLLLQSGPLTGRVLDVSREGLVFAIPLLDASGSERGVVEEVIPFFRFSPQELLQRMESLDGSHHEIYRGLIQYSAGNLPAARRHLEAAGTDLALEVKAVLDAQVSQPVF